VTSAAPSPIRFGFLGAGGIAREALAPAVHRARGATLQAVAARDVTRARSLEPAGNACQDYAAVLADPEVDVVYISLSNESHRPWTLAALAAGKHVLCEKPLGLDADEVAEMTAAAQAADRLLVEAFWYRWHPRTRRFAELVAQGALGGILQIESTFSFLGDFEGADAHNFRLEPERGGGAQYDVGCYALSGIELTFANEPLTGPARAVPVVDRVESRIGSTGVDLASTAWLHLDRDGDLPTATAVARFGMGVPDTQEFRLSGTEANLSFGSGDAFTSWNTPSWLEIRSRSGQAHREEFAPVDPYQVMVEAVAARVRGEDGFVVDLDHSAAVARLSDAVRAARSVVTN